MNRHLPYTEINVSRLGFGTASMHHIFSSKARQELLNTAFDLGITHFDTSPYYGYGFTEKVLGDFARYNRDSITITTKIGLYPYGKHDHNVYKIVFRKAIGKISSRYSLPRVSFSLNDAERSLANSLRGLRTDYIDFLLLHEPIYDIINLDEMSFWLNENCRKGNIRSYGIAGKTENIEPFLQTDLVKVVQTNDSIELREADILIKLDRELQFTYGYFSGNALISNSMGWIDLVNEAFKRNKNGCVLFSTRKIDRLRNFKNIL